MMHRSRLTGRSSSFYFHSRSPPDTLPWPFLSTLQRRRPLFGALPIFPPALFPPLGHRNIPDPPGDGSDSPSAPRVLEMSAPRRGSSDLASQTLLSWPTLLRRSRRCP